MPFKYFYKFNQKGKYIIQYSFKKYLTKINHMFYDCKFISKLDLSNFKTKNVINMSYMFGECSSLSNLDLSKFNTQNVTDMSGMFNNCNSLTNLNLSNFNTKINDLQKENIRFISVTF